MDLSLTWAHKRRGCEALAAECLGAAAGKRGFVGPMAELLLTELEWNVVLVFLICFKGVGCSKKADAVLRWKKKKATWQVSD